MLQKINISTFPKWNIPLLAYLLFIKPFHLLAIFDAKAEVLTLLISLTKGEPRDQLDFTTYNKHLLLYKLLDIINMRESPVVMAYTFLREDKFSYVPAGHWQTTFCVFHVWALTQHSAAFPAPLPKTPHSSRGRTERTSAPYSTKLSALYLKCPRTRFGIV